MGEEWGEGDIFWKSGRGGVVVLGAAEHRSSQRGGGNGNQRAGLEGWETLEYFGHRVTWGTSCLLSVYGVPQVRWAHQSSGAGFSD